MQDHVIICGYGRNGKQAAQKLLAYNRNYVIIEKTKKLLIIIQMKIIYLF